MRTARYLAAWMIAELFASVLIATDTERDRATLKGLEGVHVIVEELKDDAERDGLTKSAIRTDVESKLRQAGIRVLAENEGLSTPGSPVLYVNANTLKNDDGLYAYSIVVQLMQGVTLRRDSSISGRAVTWSNGGVGTVGQNTLRKIREDVCDHVDQFINAYLSVNPKE